MWCGGGGDALERSTNLKKEGPFLMHTVGSLLYDVITVWYPNFALKTITNLQRPEIVVFQALRSKPN